MLKRVHGVWYGTDPEGFLKRDGSVIGSERVLPEEGLILRAGAKPHVVRDGIQFELNPPAMPNVLGLGRGIGLAFRALKETLDRNPGVNISFEGVVEVDRTELDALSERSRILGCMPSRNAYADKPITVDPLVYRKRSAGGHEHFGLHGTNIFSTYTDVDERQRLIPLLDMFVANTAVMLDRDPGAAERRENYGRAGEYRLPDHGVEYRTLSNFWLRNYSLMSLMFGLSDIAISVLDESLSGVDIEQEIIDVVNIQSFIQAIDTNDFELARKNFLSLVPFMLKHLPEKGETFVLRPSTINRFLTFTDLVKVKGLEAIFPQDPVEHWINGNFVEFPRFLEVL